MLGDRIDTNGPWLSRELRLLGIETIERRSIHDRVDAIADAIKSLATNCDVLIVTGGLGPTKDDRTREAFALALDKDLVKDAAAHASMVAWFEKRDASMPAANDVQAMIPETASWIPNVHGTAPGLLGSVGHCTVLCLPGPPSELQPMFQQVKSDVCSSLSLGEPVMTIELHAWGMAESIAGAKIEDLMQSEDPTVGILMGERGLTARITGSDESQLTEVAQEITNRWSPWVYGNAHETIATSVGLLLVNKKGTLATAESCTGGCLSGLLVGVSGASDWFHGGWVTYSNDLKASQLGVDQQLIEEHGAVSSEVAIAMCRGAIQQSGATCALSTTGIAGPSGGSTEKPVGTVYIASCVDEEMQVRLFQFSGDRKVVGSRAANTALQLLRLQLSGVDTPELCWQHGVAVRC